MSDHRLAFTALTLLALSSLASAQTIAPTNSLPNPYRSIENWGQLPEGRVWGSTSAVAIDPDGTSVWVGERCGETRPPTQINPGAPFACAESKLDPILKFDPSGKLLKSFGAGVVVFPHGLFVDRDGNVWVTEPHPDFRSGRQVHRPVDAVQPAERYLYRQERCDLRGRLRIGVSLEES